MTKSQVVARLAKKAGIQKKAAASVLKELETLALNGRCGDRFNVPGLGNAIKANRKMRKNSAAFSKKGLTPASSDEVFATLAKVFSKM
jgi:nucleoid DNA-binding protein